MLPKSKSKVWFLSLIDLLNLSFVLVLLFFLLYTHDYNPYTDKLYILYGFVSISIISLSYWRNGKSIRINNIYFLLTAIVVFFVLYDSLSGLLPLFVGDLRYDATIDQWDKSFFGISPSVWMERFANPVLTEFLYFFYAIYFILPFILVISIYRNKEYKELEITMFTIFLNYYGAYICYFFVPVEGPRYFLVNEHTQSLDGIFLSQTIRDVINSYEPSTLDCFPSLHTSTLVVITLLASRYYRKLYMPYILMGIVIIFSLVYLRYHYILDILAGIIWALISFYASAWVYKKYGNVYHQHIIQ